MRRPPLRRIALVGAVGALAAAAAGCGGDDEVAQTPGFTTPEGVTTPRTNSPPRITSTPRTTTTPKGATTPKVPIPPTVTTAPQVTTAPKATTRPKTSTTPKPTAPRTSTTNEDPPPKSSSADTRLRNTAARYARGRFGVRTLARDVTLRRSRRNPRWAIASGAQGRTLWVVWLRDGRVALATKDTRRFNPPSVPCDVRPAFSEPSC